jgi:hypothetical protein
MKNPRFTEYSGIFRPEPAISWMTVDGTKGRLNHLWRNNINSAHLSCTRIHTKYTVISVTTVTQQSKKAMTVGMTLCLGNLVLSPTEGGLRHA